uniref:C-X-C motif chemokine ligand 8 n=1 Tax=Anser cygnoides TaxID=8845 RepID=A0A8B9IM71_ANSCY
MNGISASVALLISVRVSVLPPPSMMLAAELRCHCIRNVRRLMLPMHLANVEIIPKVKSAATLKNSQQICLDPQAKWVKMIINRILHSDFPPVQLKPTIN